MLGSLGNVSVLMLPSGIAIAGIVVCGIMLLNVGTNGLIGTISRYLGLEMLSLGLGNSIIGVKYSRIMVRWMNALTIWVLIVVSVLFVHVLAPLGIIGGLPFMLAWWLWIGGLSVLVLPIVSIGWNGIVMIGNMIWASGIASIVLKRGNSELREVGTMSSTIKVQLWWMSMMELLTFSGIVRGIWGIVNWIYQCVYFGLRMWLVFVLHAFSVGWFMSLYDGFANGIGIGIVALGGIFGAAIVLGGMWLGYLGIQVYVYVSFMTSFMYYCALGWFRGESVDVNVRSVVVSNGNVVKSSRTMYGGRNSALVGGLPCWVWMIVVNFGMFSGLGFGAVADSMIIGLSWIVCSWTSASCREKNLISGGTIDRVGTLTAFAWLLLFEVAFFFGAVWVIWEYCLDGGYGCVGFGTEGVDSGIGSLGKVEMLVIGSGSKLSASGKMMEIGASVTSDNGLFIGATVMGTICGALTTVQVPVLGSLIILLCVTLVIQMLHREVVMDESVCYTSVCLSEEQGQEMKSEALIVLVGEAVMILLVLLVIASLVTVLERKVLGAGQRREGPSWCGWSGLVQIAGDGIKLMMKYVWVSNAGMIGYHREWSRVWIGVSVVFVLVYAGFGMIWISIIVNEISGSVLLVWVLLGIGHLGTVICGTVLSSGWGMLGAYRNLLVWIGYDIVLLLGWIALGSGIMEESEALGLESTLHCEQYGIGMFGWLLLLAWTMGMIMEGGRIPYDMGECESELVSGYVTEYGALGYGLLASAEYGVVVLGSLLWSRMILGWVGMNGMFFGVLFVWIMLMIVRLTLPRVRIADGVMQVCYLILMPGLILASIIALYI